MAAKCLLVRNKPYGKVDMFDVALEHSCAFLGYPAIVNGGHGEISTLEELVVPFNASPTEWECYKREQTANSSKTQEHRNKCCELLPGRSFLLMPRLSDGKVYIGTYTHFAFHEEPAWQDIFWERYEAAEKKPEDRDPKLKAIASVCQTLQVDKWTPVPFVRIPAWIRAQCFGQSGAAWIKSIDERSVANDLGRARLGNTILPMDNTNDTTEVAKRLLEMVTPEPFEHLMVALLQLENPEQTWLQVGGAGDGGVDGIGFLPDGTLAGVLQCKWQYDGSQIVAENLASVPIHLAYLLGPKSFDSSNSNVISYDLLAIAKLVVKHSEGLPLATTLKVQSE